MLTDSIRSNNWAAFSGVTNVLWIRYLIDKLIKLKSFPSKKGVSPSPGKLKRMLMALYDRSSRYHSAIEMVLTDELFTEYSCHCGSDTDLSTN